MANSSGTLGGHALWRYVNAGSWYAMPTNGVQTTLVTLLNQGYAVHFAPGRDCVMTGLAVNVTVLGLGTIRAGIYLSDLDTGMPGPLVADFGSTSTGLAGQKIWTVSQQVYARPYFLMLVQNTVACTLTARSGVDPAIGGSSPVGFSDGNCYTFPSLTTGALPSTLPNPTGISISPVISVQLT